MRAVVSILVFATCAALAEPARAAVPRDFCIVAIFEAGGGAPAGDGTTAITVTITADGKVVIRSGGYYTHDQRVTARIETLRLSGARLDEIAAAVRQNRFFSLPPTDMGGTEDSLGYVLTITLDGRKHRVDVTPPFEKIPELRRFRAVWATVMQAMPSPLGRVATKHLQKYI
jgi:hypothetical protein